MHKLFQVRQCDDNFFAIALGRACNIKFGAVAPCVGKISTEDYQQDVGLAALFLQGKSANVLKVFQDKMEQASSLMDYGRLRAIAIRFPICAGFRSANMYMGPRATWMYLHWLKKRGAVVLSAICPQRSVTRAEESSYSNELGLDAAALLQAFLLNTIWESSMNFPNHAWSDYDSEFEVLHQALEQRAERKIHLATLSGQRQWLALAAENAAVNLQARVAARSQMKARFGDLQSVLCYRKVPGGWSVLTSVIP